jgi:predicted  nucleic acid-binding Zn-ribbon protein
MVLVPAMLVTRMPPDLLEALLAHELAHIKRHDYLVNLLQSAIEALLFYHPVVWWLSRQIRIEREQIADDLAAVAIGDPRRLALALQALDELQLDNPVFPDHQPALAANGGILMTRIQRLIRPSQHALDWKMALPIIGLAAFCLTVYAHDGNSVAPGSKKEASATGETHTAGRISQSPGRQGDAYALIRAGQDGMVMSGDTRDIPAIEKVKANVQGDFIWARRGQKTYVVQDPAIIAKVVEIRRPADALDVQMEALDAKMEAPSKQMEALSAQMEALEKNSHPYNEAMEKTGAQMQALGRQQEAIGQKMQALERQHDRAKLSEQEADALDRQMETLQTQMEPLSRQMEQLNVVMEAHNKEMQAAQQPMEDLSRQMEAASKPMEALGQQMDVLGKQMEQVSSEADQAVKALIDDAVRNGKAAPADTATR